MNLSFEEIKKSMGRFPAFYPEYDEEGKIFNCYAYALNITFAKSIDVELFAPGIPTAIYNGSDYFYYLDDDLDFYDVYVDMYRLFGINNAMSEYEIDTLEKLLKRDCQKLGLRICPCDISKKTGNFSYKILLCTTPIPNDWHFVRESVSFEGEKVWTHKLGWILPVSEVSVDTEHNRIIFPEADVPYSIRRCYEIFF